VDFSQTESTTESHKPNQTAESGAVRSQQVVESNAVGTTAPSGVPGATTNQPPAQASAPINGAAQTLAVSGQAGTAVGAGGKRESIINYEVDKTVRVVKGATGVIRRINAAVVVNNQSSVDAKGKTVSTPLTDAQIEKMTALVREAVGFNKDRGDSVNLMNAPFAAEKIEVNDIPVWRQPEVVDIARSLAWPVGTLLFAGMVLMGIIRPAMKSMAPATNTGAEAGAQLGQLNQLDAIESEQPDRPQLSGPRDPNAPAETSESELRLEEARKLTRDNPAAVANIVKAWINGESPT
jgi:flagellar M-ring protein FliF